MPSRQDNPDARPVKPPRWVSPWSFDDEWEDEQRRHAAANRQAKVVEKQAAKKEPPPAPEVAVSPPAQSKAPELPAVSARPAATPTIVSFREEVLPADLKVAPDIPPVSHTNPPPADLDRRFRPPSAELPRQNATASPPPKAEPARRRSAFDPPVEDLVGIDPPTSTPQKRPGPVPISARQRYEPRFPWGTVLTSILGVAGIFLLGSIYLIDAPPVSDDDLLIKAPVDTAPKIAGPERLITFLQAVNTLPDVALAQKPAWKWEAAFLQSFMQGNGAALDALRDLLGDFDWHPHHAVWYQEDHGEHSSWPHVRILLQARVANLLRFGDEQAALSAALDLGRLSRCLQEMWSWPSYSLRSQELHLACVQMTAQVLKNTRLSSAELKPFQEEFMKLTPRDDLLQGALSAFYLHEKKLIFGEKSGEPLDTMPRGVLQERPGRLFFKKQETLGLFAEACRQMRDQVVEAPFSVGPARRLSFVKPRARFSFQPNGAGESYFTEQFDSIDDLPERHHLARARHSLVVSLFAIRRYLADHQKLPSGLTDLQSDYLSDMPLDPYSGEPLHYDPLKGVLFSVGDDFHAEDGRITEPPLADNSEPTIELGIAIATLVPTGQ